MDLQALDPTSGVIDTVRRDMRTFRRAHNNGEELPMQRRRLLQAMLAATALPVTDSMIGAVSASATTMERHDSNEALAEVARTLHEVCQQGMMGVPIEQSHRRSLECWRDALALKVNTSGPRHARASEMEAKAACLMAQFHGDLGNYEEAAKWYARATSVTKDRDLLSWIHTCSAWIPMFRGDGEGVVKAVHKALNSALLANPVQEAFAFSQLARGHAIRGDKEEAHKALGSATRAYARYGYYEKNRAPSFDGFSKWQFAAYAVNTYAILGDVEQSREPRAVLRDIPFQSDINKMLSTASEATCLVHEGEPVGGVLLLRSSIDGLPERAASTAVVRGRAKMFVDQMPPLMQTAGEVHEFKEYLATA